MLRLSSFLFLYSSFFLPSNFCHPPSPATHYSPAHVIRLNAIATGAFSDTTERLPLASRHRSSLCKSSLLTKSPFPSSLSNLPILGHPSSTHPSVSSDPPKLEISHDSITFPKVHVKALIISGQSHVFSFSPETTVGRVKELIWSSWPKEWTDPAQPPSPKYLRLLYSGRILQDDSTLSSNHLPLTTSSDMPTVIHISVRSFSIKDDEAKKPSALARSLSRRSHPAAEEEVSGCRCLIM
ncbi:uncharacterized protein IAS62_005327 [Cryptococcus decagattii]|uniref:Ubiquitin-like domain-containing protein n=1 Tax=Cryptococcus decagattii TaxID=1859122 RepID=A0ABZ2B1J1_9TREE